ncbi:hypothetical protein [Oceanibaculum pacificum]|uniref:Iron uptake protein n=1 Tax=Oceanibaculum pacificum TaxID=580166 RepID=A0A154W2X5_9PROT|nr:hypothetical protein [Oceanibaculum pacificum]KZD07846.1 hypothetical protein AUP43_09495 [Oceanibaculum pacificum]
MADIASSPPRWQPAALLVLRLLAVIVGGYYLTAALVSLGAAGMAGIGLPGSEAVVLAAMLGFLVYLGLLIWGFAERRMRLLCLVFLGGPLLAQGLLYLQAGG